ncbi:MAG: hypothetical protein ACLQBB_03875 [Solirubrobacteraceae bacterium]
MQSLPGTLVFGLAGNGLTFVVFGTVAFSVVMSVLFLVTRGNDSMYDQIGQGGISRESDYSPPGAAPAESSPAARAEQEQEIRQMLGARSERRVRRGEPALDIDAEVARLLAPDAGSRELDHGLVTEVRQLVLARNERRQRQGMEPLDVEAEVARTLQELDP